MQTKEEIVYNIYFRFKPLKHRMHRGDQEGKNKPAKLDIRVGLSAYITSDDDTWSALPTDFVKNVGGYLSLNNDACVRPYKFWFCPYEFTNTFILTAHQNGSRTFGATNKQRI